MPCGLDEQRFVVQGKRQIIFDSDGMAALKLRGPEAKILALIVALEEE
jgi:hypothetical protein